MRFLHFVVFHNLDFFAALCTGSSTVLLAFRKRAGADGDSHQAGQDDGGEAE